MTESVRNRFKVYSILFSAVVIGGTAGIMAAEDFSFLNAFYFMIVTMATVGYGDVHPVTAAGKILTILIIITGVGTFVGAIANATEFMLVRRDMQVRMNKLNMVIGVFFSEVGLRLLAMFSAADPRLEDIRGKLMVTGKWTDQEFRNVSAEIRSYDCTIRTDTMDLAQLQAFTSQKRDFLVRLLENPLLLEHETFTDLLRAVFHLAEELVLPHRSLGPACQRPGPSRLRHQAGLYAPDLGMARLHEAPENQLPLSFLARLADQPLRPSGAGRGAGRAAMKRHPRFGFDVV